MRRSIYLTFVLSAALLWSICPADSPGPAGGKQGHDWPQWRGVNRDAVSPESGLVNGWPESGPKVLWRVEVGAGYSSVSVSDGRLYTLWDEKGTQFLVCLDALTGRELWRQGIGAAFNHHYGNGPRSTPLVDGGTVFAVGTAGRLLAVNRKSGKIIWQHDLARESKAELPPYGYASSPLVTGDKIVLEAGAENAAYIAFDKTSGEIVWRSHDDLPAYSSPIEVSIGGARQIVFWSGSGLHAVSPKDGSVLWEYAWETFCPVTGAPLNTGTPIFIAPDRLFISSRSGAAVIRISRTGKAFAAQTVWKSEEMKSDVNTSVMIGNHVYGFDGGILECLDARTGEVTWKARGFQKGSLIAADGKLIVLGETGNLALVDANPEAFIQKDSAEILEGKCWTAPTLADGKLYLRNHEELVSIDMRAGK